MFSRTFHKKKILRNILLIIVFFYSLLDLQGLISYAFHKKKKPTKKRKNIALGFYRLSYDDNLEFLLSNFIKSFLRL